MFSFLGSDFFTNLFSSPWVIFVNTLDVVIVAWAIYSLIKSLVGTRVMTLIQGVVLFLILRLIAQWIGLTTVSWLMNQVVSYGVIAGVIIFSPEIRSFLEKFGRTPQYFIQTHQVSHEDKMITAFVDAVKYMSPRKIGALVSIERTQTLQEYISTGIPLDADISSQLLINIFIPNTPLHDGAVIVKDDKIVTACSYLPLSESTHIPKEFGTRHRAAIGLSEVSDAFTFVVSEETGGISVTYRGEFRHDISYDEFEATLRNVLLEKNSEPKNFWQRFRKGGKK